ncbi:MAG TPA: DUF4388 domain-containing protein, partial [bacterium]|nr:DUF4388 domain-containing protein [bacterium]
FSLGAEAYITKPVSIRQLALKIEARIKQIQTQKHHMTKGLRGNLKDQGVADIVQFIELSEHTGRLSIEFRNREGQIQFRGGQIFWADFPPMSGVDAIYALMALNSGTFRFETTEDIVETNRIRVDNYALILEGMKRIDEQGRETLLKPVLEDIPFAPLPDGGESENNAEVRMGDTREMRPVRPADRSGIPQDVADGLETEPIQAADETESIESSASLTEVETVEAASSTEPAEPAEAMLKTVPELIYPEWIWTTDFQVLSAGISEIEDTDVSGEWVSRASLNEVSEMLITAPGCIILSSQDPLLTVFRTLSELFFIQSPVEDGIPLVTARWGQRNNFRMLGYPIEAVESMPHACKGIPFLLYFPSDTIDEVVPAIRTIFGSTVPELSVGVTDAVDTLQEALKAVDSEGVIPVISGNFATWLSTLLTLSKFVKQIRISDD